MCGDWPEATVRAWPSRLPAGSANFKAYQLMSARGGGVGWGAHRRESCSSTPAEPGLATLPRGAEGDEQKETARIAKKTHTL